MKLAAQTKALICCEKEGDDVLQKRLITLYIRSKSCQLHWDIGSQSKWLSTLFMNQQEHYGSFISFVYSLDLCIFLLQGRESRFFRTAVSS